MVVDFDSPTGQEVWLFMIRLASVDTKHSFPPKSQQLPIRRLHPVLVSPTRTGTGPFGQMRPGFEAEIDVA